MKNLSTPNISPKVTLLIPTFNRPQYLLRILRFYQSYDFPFPILVLDSSDQEITNNELIHILKSENITHQKFKSDVFFVEKVSQGTNLLNTPYSVLCADDDFIFPDAIAASISFLESHSDFVMAYGSFIVHDLIDNRFIWNLTYFNVQSIDDSFPLNRYRSIQTKSHCPLLYAVTKSNIMKKIWRETALYANHWGLFESLLEGLGALHGKIMLLPLLYCSREINYYNWISPNDLNRMYSKEKVASLISGLIENARKLNIEPIADFEKNVHESVHSCVKMVFEKKEKYETQPERRSMNGLKYFLISLAKFFYYPRYKEHNKIASLPNFKQNLMKLKEYVRHSLEDELVNSRKSYSHQYKESILEKS